MTLAELSPGETGFIVSVGGAGPLRRRLMDMGLLPGQAVKVEKVAPLGDPIEVTIRSYALSLRRQEAEGVEVRP